MFRVPGDGATTEPSDGGGGPPFSLNDLAPPVRRRMPWVVAGLGVLVVLLAATVAVLLLRDGPATPAAAVSAAPVSSRDAYGEDACRRLEKMRDAPVQVDTYYADMTTIAMWAVQASDEAVREEGELLLELLRTDGTSAIAVQLRSEGLVEACDDANYAF